MSIASSRPSVKTPMHRNLRPAGAKRRRSPLLAGAIAAGGVALLVWLAPILIAKTPVLGWAVGKATGKLDGRVHIATASLGWFSPVDLSGIELTDREGKPVANVARVTSQKRLAGLLLNLADLGSFQLDRPELNIVVRPDGSNLEDVLAKYLQEPASESKSKTGLSLVVRDGRVNVTDAGRKQAWQIDQLQASVQCDPRQASPVVAQVSGVVLGGAKPGRFEVGLRMPANRPDAATAEAALGQANLTADLLPLALCRAAAARFAPLTQLDGALSATAQCQWGGAALEQNFLRANLAIEEFALGATPLGADQVQLRRVESKAELNWLGRKLGIKQLSMQSDVASGSLTGALDLADVDKRTVLDLLGSQGLELILQADGARLARMLPGVLHLQKETEIQAAQFRLGVTSKPHPEGFAIAGRLDTSDVRAVHAGQPIVWQQPVQVSFAARQSVEGITVESLKCQSKFLGIEASGTPGNLGVTARLDLNQLVAELGRFVDMGGLRLAGEAWFRLNWQRTPQNHFETETELQVRNFALADATGKSWAEPNVRLFASASGVTDLTMNTRVDAFAIHGEAGADKLDVKLRSAMPTLNAGPWPMEAKLQGNLENWPARLALWMPGVDWKAAGPFQLSATAGVTTSVVEASEVLFMAKPFQFAGMGLLMNEPHLSLTANDARWQNSARVLDLKQASLITPPFAAQLSNGKLTLPAKGGLTLGGGLKYQGSLDRMQNWFVNPQSPTAWRIAGKLAGEGRFEQAGTVTTAQLDTAVENLSVSSNNQQLAEPQMRLVAAMTYDNQTGTLDLQQCELTSATIAARAKGKTGGNQTALQGAAQYDLGRLCTLLRPYLGPNVNFTGRRDAPLALRGPLDLATAQGETALAWDSAYCYGFRSGPGTLKLNLTGGVVRAEPLNLDVNEGRMQLAPSLKLAPGEAELNLEPGQVAQQIRIDPAMCNTALLYALPALAGVAEAEGKFSVVLDRCRIPLANPSMGQFQGRMIVHSVQIGPGALIRELAVVLGREAPARLQQESIIPFQMQNGRIYHQGMELVFPDWTVRTQGSVGLDRTIDLLAEMPVPPKWLANNPAATALRNQVIQLPIGGTLDRPGLDRRRLAEASQRFIGTAAKNVLEDKVKQQLDRLFGPQ